VADHTEGADPALLGATSSCPTARAVPAFQLLQERVKAYTPEWAEGITGIPAATIRRLAHEMGITARDQKIELPIAWTDAGASAHDTSPATRWPSMRCAGWPRTPTVSRPSARWRS
jgi:anaerobic selenocysteine-containing dehydrogenase